MARKSDREAAKAHRAGLKRHRADQARHRAKNEARRRPARDDVAGAAVRYLLNSMVAHPDQASAWIAILARDLASLKAPFDPAETTAVMEAMVERHRKAMAREACRRAEERGT